MVNAFPPSYHEATAKDHWSLVAGYLSGDDLCAACLVSRRWHATFAPFLWGDPASHFGTENDRVYVALTRFKRALPTASLHVRELTHTLHLPPAQSEIYDGPKAEWLRDVLERLPCLQSLLVSRLPFFDHAALLAMRRYSNARERHDEDEIPQFSVRLLIASGCTNATSGALAEGLSHLPGLVFLDLSETTAARDPAVLHKLHHMPELQVLKLRAVGLRDEDLGYLADAIKIRVRSLDLRNNRLTDISVRTLLAHCFHSVRDVHSEHSELRRNSRLDGNWPTSMPVPNDSLVSEMRENDLDEKFLQGLTKPGAGSILSDLLPAPGVTHLYISNNFISLDGIAGLVERENLHVLDAGTLYSASIRPSHRSSLSQSLFAAPDAEKLTPLLEKHGGKNLTFLRLNHAIVTQPAGPREKAQGPLELEATGIQYELDNVGTAVVEMPVDESICELSAEAPTPRYELAAEPVKVISPPPWPEQMPLTPNRGAVFAPEVVEGDQEPLIGQSHESRGFSHTAESLQQPNGHVLAATAAKSAASRISQIEQRRKQLRNDPVDSACGLLPGCLASLSTLVLTEVPAIDDSNGTIIKALQRFISDCAEESELATSQAALESTTISMAGQLQPGHEARRSKELFGLQRIVLELSPQIGGPVGRRRSPSEGSGSPRSPATPTFRSSFMGWSNQQERSSTGDPDTEAFWKAQENDFSFFGDEECGQPVRDPGARLPRRAVEEKMALPTEAEDTELLSPARAAGFTMTSSPQRNYLNSPEPEGRDVVAELARWRKEKKQLAESARGLASGHWKGEIKVVRPRVER